MKHQAVEYVMTMEMVFHAENPSRINHINVSGPWRQFAIEAGFAYDKLIRFRFMHLIEDLDAGADQGSQYHVFHLVNLKNIITGSNLVMADVLGSLLCVLFGRYLRS